MSKKQLTKSLSNSQYNDATITESSRKALAAQRIKNEAAIQLLRLWRTGDEQEQQETWQYLKRVLDEDRLSNRRLFP